MQPFIDTRQNRQYVTQIPWDLKDNRFDRQIDTNPTATFNDKQNRNAKI